MKTLYAIAIVSSAVLLGAQGRPPVMIEWAYSGSEQSLLRGHSHGSESPLGAIPVTKPPYAELVAIDLNKGEIAWAGALR